MRTLEAPLRVPYELRSLIGSAAHVGCKLSPDAAFLALAVQGRDGDSTLAVVDLAGLGITTLHSLPACALLGLHWANNGRLLYQTADSGVHAMDRDGGHATPLIDRHGKLARAGAAGFHFLHYALGAQDGDTVYALGARADDNGDAEYLELLELDTRTAVATAVPRPGATFGWWLDAQGEPRAALTVEQEEVSVHYRDPGLGRWRRLARHQRGAADGWEPLGFAADGALLALTEERDGVKSIRTVDTDTGEAGATILATMPAGEVASLRRGWRRAAGVGTTWFDAGMRRLQHEVDALLPGTRNLISGSIASATSWLLVESGRSILLYHAEMKTLVELGRY